jgi:hypothetical protein
VANYIPGEEAVTKITKVLVEKKETNKEKGG